VKIRRLRPSEREQWLELLDGWQLLDGWRGRDFFRRCLEGDPSYDDANVWVAEADGRLVSTVQIFPRRLGVGGAEVPTGGIGSVYTRPDRRQQGIASALLQRSVADMRERGMELSLLFAERIPFYSGLGWCSWPMRRELLRLGPEAAARPAEEAGAVERFEPERDLESVATLHAESSSRLAGASPRNPADWRASLRLAGNPAEEFLVLRGGAESRLRAYLRAIRLNEVLVVAEYGVRDAEALAALCRALLVPREPDPLAPAGRSSARFRSFAVLPLAADAGLAAALGRRGIARSPIDDPTPMLRCLDAEALARRLGIPLAPAEPSDAFLRRALPPERFAYWPSDRF
jgi:GNAT superfamily N-acetyltransferase